jgi:hypothetical protein
MFIVSGILGRLFARVSIVGVAAAIAIINIML